MTWGMVAVAGASLVGGMMSADAASSAADAQVGASDRSVQVQRDIFNKQVELQDPFRQLGLGAGQRLSYLLGITPQTGITPGVPISPRAELPSAPTASTGALSPTVATGGAAPAASGPSADQIRQWYDAGLLHATGAGQPFINGLDGSQIDANLVSRAVAGFSDSPQTPVASFAPAQSAQPAQAAPTQAAAAPIPSAENSFNGTPLPNTDNSTGFGSLLHNFGAQDFQLDPGIQFQMQQGQQALQNSQSAKDGILGGAALKGLMDFNQRMAGTGYQSAFDRYMANKGFTLGSLMDMTKLGQSAASGAAANGAGYATSIGNTITGAGNAQAAGAVGQANAISGGLGGAANMFMLRNLMSGGGSGGGGVIADSPIANFA